MQLKSWKRGQKNLYLDFRHLPIWFIEEFFNNIQALFAICSRYQCNSKFSFLHLLNELKYFISSINLQILLAKLLVTELDTINRKVNQPLYPPTLHSTFGVGREEGHTSLSNRRGWKEYLQCYITHFVSALEKEPSTLTWRQGGFSEEKIRKQRHGVWVVLCYWGKGLFIISGEVCIESWIVKVIPD